MKALLKMYSVEIERFGWFITLGVITLIGFILVLTKTLSFDAYFIGLCFIVGLAYVASVLKKSKKEALNEKMKQLLVETKDNKASLGVMPELDNLNVLMREVGPLLDTIVKNDKQSKHFRNRRTNNNKQILD